MVTINEKTTAELDVTEKVNTLRTNLLNNGYRKIHEEDIAKSYNNEVLGTVVSETWLNPFKKIETTIHRKYNEGVLVGYEIFNKRLTNEEF